MVVVEATVLDVVLDDVVRTDVGTAAVVRGRTVACDVAAVVGAIADVVGGAVGNTGGGGGGGGV